MPDFRNIKVLVERNAEAVRKRPSIGQRAATTRARSVDGLRCEIEDGPWRLTADMSEKWGGSDVGPTPGGLARGALGACLAQAYVIWAARLEIPINAVAVDVEAHYDARGLCGVSDDVPPGYTAVRCLVTIDSPAPRDELTQMMQKAETHCPILDVFRRDQNVTIDLTLTSPREE